MKKNVIVFITCVSAAIFLSCSKPKPPSRNVQLTQKLDLLCDSIHKAFSVPGLAVGVWDEKKRFYFIKGYGYANIPQKLPMNAEAPFRIGSNTKTFTVTALLQLVDEGIVKLDDKLDKYFPNIMQADKVTLRMLCNMTAGYPDYTQKDEFKNMILSEPMHNWTFDEILAVIQKYPMDFAPGVSVNYSNSNTILLCLVIEKVTGKTMKENFQTRFFDKFSFKKTIFPYDNTYPGNGIRGYDISGNKTEDVTDFYSLSWANGAGALISTMTESKKWIELLIDGKLLKSTTHKERFKYDYGAKLKYGLGIFDLDGMWGHNGGLPGFNSTLMKHPKTGLTIVVFLNFLDNTHTSNEVAQKIQRVVNFY